MSRYIVLIWRPRSRRGCIVEMVTRVRVCVAVRGEVDFSRYIEKFKVDFYIFYDIINVSFRLVNILLLLKIFKL